MRNFREYTIFDNMTPVAVTSSTDATPIVVTATSHGFKTGQLVTIQGHTTNIAANGTFKVGTTTTNTFQLLDRYSGANVAGSGAGAGSGGVVTPAPNIVWAEDAIDSIISVFTSGSANFTGKVAGSIGMDLNDYTSLNGDTPNFGATQSKSNPYTFISIIDQDSNAGITGSNGVTTAGTDLAKLYEVNANALKYFTFLITAWSAGAITVKAKVFDRGK